MATIYLKKQRLVVYYQAQDMDGILIKEFSYCVNEEIRLLKDDIWSICWIGPRCAELFQLRGLQSCKQSGVGV